MVSDSPALAEQGADEDFELADKMRGVSAVLVDSVEKLRFVARRWLACLRPNGLERNEVGKKARKYLRLFDLVRPFTIMVPLYEVRLTLNVGPQPVDQSLVETIGGFQLSRSSLQFSKEVLFIDGAIEFAQNLFTFVVAVAFGIWVESAYRVFVFFGKTVRRLLFEDPGAFFDGHSGIRSHKVRSV